jgi:hypothetical protein
MTAQWRDAELPLLGTEPTSRPNQNFGRTLIAQKFKFRRIGKPLIAGENIPKTGKFKHSAFPLTTEVYVCFLAHIR